MTKLPNNLTWITENHYKHQQISARLFLLSTTVLAAKTSRKISLVQEWWNSITRSPADLPEHHSLLFLHNRWLGGQRCQLTKRRIRHLRLSGCQQGYLPPVCESISLEHSSVVVIPVAACSSMCVPWLSDSKVRRAAQSQPLRLQHTHNPSSRVPPLTLPPLSQWD